ncbi:hypothetical protein PIB30_100001 [Stylosanthes scabra]|uniref:Uncharacterized protein n=1 Tax=Stylosanthes scabra TaxID=79078 RepID=A0ABU6UXA9_9FABA|nr:hypothetical protein [Stylosanthes scabra]
MVFQDGVIHAHSPLFVAFGEHHHVAKPSGVFYLPNKPCLWATGLLPGSMDNLWLEKFASIPDMSAAVHANKSTFLLRKWVSPAFTSSDRFFAITVTWSASGPICTLSSSPSGCGLSRIFFLGSSRSMRRTLVAMSDLQVWGVALWSHAVWHHDTFLPPRCPLSVLPHHHCR